MGLDFELYSMYHNTDANTIGITTPLGLIEEECAVGENFLRYLNLDFNYYNEFYKLYNEFHLASLRNKPQKTKNKEQLFLESCKKIYSSWVEETMVEINELEQYRDETNDRKNISSSKELRKLNVLNAESVWFENQLNKIKRANSFQELKKLNVLDDIFLRVLKVSVSSEHPYIHCSRMLFERDLDIKKYQDRFKQVIDFCFNKDYSIELNSLSAWERYYLWQLKNSTINHISVIDFYEPTIECSYAILPKKDFSFENKRDIVDGELNNKAIQSLKSVEIFPVRLNHCKTPTEYAFCEFHAMLDSNIKIKRCDFCGNYFILSGNYHTKYCTDCKNEAIKSARKSKVDSSPILKEYEKAYKRMYARRTNQRMTYEEFLIWTEKASAKRDIFNERYNSAPSEDLVREFKDFLENK
ncbi:MAG: DUF6076 domain-containing protein [Hungatella sp.]|jgi:hypothetical protein|nr:DUF6076 domain-containing protein [Hungatella sp.]